MSYVVLIFRLLNLLCGVFSFRETGDILLKICNLMPQDTGIYTCTAINDHGTASSSASIKVQGNVEKGDDWCAFYFHLKTLRRIIKDPSIFSSSYFEKGVIHMFCFLCLLRKKAAGEQIIV